MVLQSKSGVKDASRLKAGHPPAVMAGGKRVAKKAFEDGHGISERETKRTDKPRSLALYSRTHQVSILLAGTLGKMGHEFPETQVSVRHAKVRPAAEKTHALRSFGIQQPRKCCSSNSRGFF
ncbi:death-associated protein-like 1-A isoform X2 [Gadus morhua]|uniref:death-associated protein-like 1 homolog n=1 Tax=Gadus macrocephalus TaxID=80720 RepID=UPI0011B826E0|nr:death-associated protein-like 1 isoform X2 [Gadus morhua]XP_059896144.1 death-associated protein-like 1 homolog [Gadus macrocephalus]